MIIFKVYKQVTCFKCNKIFNICAQDKQALEAYSKEVKRHKKPYSQKAIKIHKPKPGCYEQIGSKHICGDCYQEM